MNKRLISFLTMTSILLTSVSPAFAKSFNSKSNVDLAHSWTVQFSHQLSSNQDFSKITITDNSTGASVPVTVHLGDDNKSLVVKPQSNYDANTSYTLKIDGIRDVNDHQLGDNATMQFSTQNSNVIPNPQPQTKISPEYIQGAEGKADLTWTHLDYSADKNGNIPDINEYEKGIVYTKDQANSYWPGSWWSGKGTNQQQKTVGIDGMAFKDGKYYHGVHKPFRHSGNIICESAYFHWIKEYTNPINPYAEKQIYTTVSNAEQLNEATPTYSLSFNDQYGVYEDDGTGKLVRSKNFERETCEYIEVDDHYDLQNIPIGGGMGDPIKEYGTVFFIETPFVKNNISYNLKMDLYFQDEDKKAGAKFLLTSCVGNKLGTDIYTTLVNNLNQYGGAKEAEYTIDGVHVCVDDYAHIYIQLQ